MKRLLTLIFALSICFFALSQKKKKVELNWKIGPDETLAYQTIMEEIDTSKVKFSLESMVKIISDSSENKSSEAKNMLKEINKVFEKIDLVTELRNNGDETIDIIMRTRPKEQHIDSTESDSTDNKAKEMMTLLQEMNQGIMLRGSIYETGGIHSFWLKSRQKNLIALFFELPTYPVKIGDSWEIDINFITNDQSFECDSAYKVNKVTLLDLKESNGGLIAVLQYDIKEYVDGTIHVPAALLNGRNSEITMSFTHHAIAEFSIDKGRWVSYDGIMGLTSSGYMNSYTKKKFSLIKE